MRHRFGIFVLDAGNFGGDAVVHVVGSFLIEMAERVFQCVLVGPYAGGELVAVKILFGCLESFLKSVSRVFHSRLDMKIGGIKSHWNDSSESIAKVRQK